MKPKIDEMGIQIVDHCNLNCKGCLHFCHKGQKPYFYAIERYERDLQRLTSLVTIGGIRIYGGEPLLHTELSRIIAISHDIVPYAKLRLFTNGLLLRSMPETLLTVLREHNVKIIWSVYPVFDDEAYFTTCKFLKAEGLAYQAERTEMFYACMRREGDIDPEYAFARCNGKNCHVMQDGKISLCPAPMVAKIMELFGFDGDVSDGLLDIYDTTLTGEQVAEFLCSPHSVCRFCTAPTYFSWQQQSDDSTLEDWISKK